MAGFAVNPGAGFAPNKAAGGANSTNPNSLISALLGLPPDVSGSIGSSSSVGGGAFGGSGGGSGGGGGAFGGAGPGGQTDGGYSGGAVSSSGNQSFSVGGNAAKASALGNDAAAAINQQGTQNRFNTLEGYFQGQMGAAGNSAPSVGAAPPITTGPVWTPSQISQQINLSNATTDQGTATQNAQQGSSLAGRGFGGQSPLLAALTNANSMAGLGQKTAQANQIGWNAAQGNATQNLASQQAAVQAWSDQAQAEAQRLQINAGRQNALINAMSSGFR